MLPGSVICRCCLPACAAGAEPRLPSCMAARSCCSSAASDSTVGWSAGLGSNCPAGTAAACGTGAMLSSPNCCVMSCRAPSSTRSWFKAYSVLLSPLCQLPSSPSSKWSSSSWRACAFLSLAAGTSEACPVNSCVAAPSSNNPASAAKCGATAWCARGCGGAACTSSDNGVAVGTECNALAGSTAMCGTCATTS